MTKDQIVEFLKNKTNWEKNISEKELWSYCSMPHFISVGRQKYDWAIFKRNKNLGFYFVDNYRDIPKDLVDDLFNLLLKSEE